MSFPKKILRQQMAWLRARYGDGAISPGIFATIKTIETEIAWHWLTNPRMSADTTAHRKGEHRHGHV
jgi:hypothetical protein